MRVRVRVRVRERREGGREGGRGGREEGRDEVWGRREKGGKEKDGVASRVKKGAMGLATGATEMNVGEKVNGLNKKGKR